MSATPTTAVSKSGIEIAPDGASFIPSSKRADGSTRKEIKVRPGYRPPEDIETYKNRSAEAWKNRGSGGVPGAEAANPTNDHSEPKSKNAKRRDAARKKAQEGGNSEKELTAAMRDHTLASEAESIQERKSSKLPVDMSGNLTEEEESKQKKVRNLLKKLKGLRDLKEKRASGEKLSPDQLVKIGKELELVKDLQKLHYTGPEISGVSAYERPESVHNDV